MRALVIDRFGGPEVLTMREITTPEPPPGHVRVKVAAIAVARTKDVATRAGLPPFGAAVPCFPHVLGTEHAGMVDEVGAGVDGNWIGRRVAVSAILCCGQCHACQAGREEACEKFALIGVHRHGSYAEYVTVPVGNLTALPDGVSMTDAASIAANGPVARAQLEAGGVGPGSTVLIIGTGGSLGSTSAALAAYRGARVIGVDRLSAHPAVLDGLPLAQRLDGDAPDLAERLRAATDPWGIDCVIDNIGAPAVWEAYRPTVADMGRIIVSGAINHDPVPMRMLPFYLRSQSLIGVRTGNRGQIAAMWHDVEDGFRPPRSHTHTTPWEAAAAAHHRVEQGTANGQTVLEVR